MDRQVVTHAEWRDWKEHPVTVLYLKEVFSIIETEIATLVTQAGQNSVSDSYKSGKIAGLTELADWKPQLVEDKDEV